MNHHGLHGERKICRPLIDGHIHYNSHAVHEWGCTKNFCKCDHNYSIYTRCMCLTFNMSAIPALFHQCHFIMSCTAAHPEG